jgi:hypothetical protein
VLRRCQSELEGAKELENEGGDEKEQKSYKRHEVKESLADDEVKVK